MHYAKYSPEHAAFLMDELRCSSNMDDDVDAPKDYWLARLSVAFSMHDVNEFMDCCQMIDPSSLESFFGDYAKPHVRNNEVATRYFHYLYHSASARATLTSFCSSRFRI